jgi:hypothetical protein
MADPSPASLRSATSPLRGEVLWPLRVRSPRPASARGEGQGEGRLRASRHIFRIGPCGRAPARLTLGEKHDAA